MKPAQMVLVIAVLIHLVLQILHGISHNLVPVPLSLWQQIFVLSVITAAPLIGLILFWRGSLRWGAGVIAVSALGATLFGYLFHFVLESPDLIFNVDGPAAPLFFHTSVGLALIEVSIFLLSVVVWLELNERESQRSVR